MSKSSQHFALAFGLFLLFVVQFGVGVGMAIGGIRAEAPLTVAVAVVFCGLSFVTLNGVRVTYAESRRLAQRGE